MRLCGGADFFLVVYAGTFFGLKIKAHE